MYIVIDESRYYVEVCGDGLVPLVLLHGFTGDSTTWAPFHESWGKSTKLIIPDIIGHGKTESPEALNRYQMDAAASDLNTILVQMGIEQVDLLGYSMGGRLALTFALLYPGRVRKLILESSSPGLAMESEKQHRRMKDAELANFIQEQGIIAFVDYWEEIPLFSTMKRLPWETQKKIRKQRLKNSPIGLTNSLLGMGTGSQYSWWGRLSELTCEVLLLTGAEDHKFCAIARQMMKEMKNSSWVVIDGCGHAIHVEEPEKFGTIVSDFLSNVNK
ncbi:2-succinyl-6-hydroxy-2,4-cyclohexadiene-1-carboxylate synthase [Neobacillus sp. SuZ13]|uniref:2-succinyl-6-hydroxy-2, 4-cyclohexadiene-1-carboxylate synthase n=1 Tax=Neobacillus sp. SuZ13 TaxID=3047875 RepID=UPI0024C02341|nr:2-succinyl-6-hydroxy-2,4-cyclohexadiene-1-carboxylate synthase [Neobacillus sp. SuZ13]WHY66075.1 2-succinyl-6-hydroxy-2,4-cyclohexadiene-1-carboxylate synthase [Neobacillus sp. SuZ13]